MSLQRSISSLQGMWDAGSEDRVICWAGGSDVQAQSGTLLGLVLAFANVFFNASSFVLKKYALRRLHLSFVVYALLVGVVLVLAAGLVSQGGGRRCILLNICVSAWASVPYTIAVKAIVMTVSEVGRLVSLRTAAWFVVVLVSFLAHVIFLNKSLEHFDPVRISQLSSCLLQLSMTATMMLLSRSWQEATPYHALLLLLAVGDVAFALLGFVLFQEDQQRSDAAVRVALRLLFTSNRLGRTPRPKDELGSRPVRKRRRSQ
ncbi:uncharacterized protein LOC121048050 [Ixodes scapularis]|uniref:uncharacterized protein LOC121048050 n=1 Tax=Ixodes scapularis TaxID=6945 RepID=UPI001AD6AD91|nr:uncharacterized protein LOC121048050 [Ixodes scapularis]